MSAEAWRAELSARRAAHDVATNETRRLRGDVERAESRVADLAADEYVKGAQNADALAEAEVFLQQLEVLERRAQLAARRLAVGLFRGSR